jgi:mannosyltransferase OCH1-like enzyme
MAVPKRIHQIWMQGKDVPARYDAARQSWRDMHPDFAIQLWSEPELKALVQHTHWEQALQLCQSMIQRADLYRCALLEYYGGIYADMDTYALESFAPLLQCAKLQLGLTSFRPGYRVSNSVILAPPGLPFWHQVFVPAVMRAFYTGTVIDDISPVLAVMRTTGPGLWADLTLKHPDKFELRPPRYFYALDVPKKRILDENDKAKLRGSFSFHMQDSAWLKSWEGIALDIVTQHKWAVLGAVAVLCVWFKTPRWVLK